MWPRSWKRDLGDSSGIDQTVSHNSVRTPTLRYKENGSMGVLLFLSVIGLASVPGGRRASRRLLRELPSESGVGGKDIPFSDG